MGVAGVAEAGKMTMKDLKHSFMLEDDASSDKFRFQIDIKQKDKKGRQGIHHACDYGRQEVMNDMIIQQEADPNARDDRGRVPLHIAAMAGHNDVVRCLVQDHECEINVQDEKGWTPLHLAARFGHAHTVKYLFELGADPLVRDISGNRAY